MYPSGVIYDSAKGQDKGAVSIHAKLSVRLLYAFIQTSSIYLVLGVLVYLLFIFGPVAKAEVDYAFYSAPTQAQAIENKSVSEDEISAVLAVQSEAKEHGINSHFSVFIPKINASENIIPNVDTSNEDVYIKALQEGVAHARGTEFPGGGKLIYLFSHSTNSSWWASRLRAVFYLLNKLEKGDKIIIFFADKKYEYEVDEIVTTSPSDTSWLNDKGQGEVLILQTCTPAGTNLKRLLVIARPVDN